MAHARHCLNKIFENLILMPIKSPDLVGAKQLTCSPKIKNFGFEIVKIIAKDTVCVNVY